MKTLYERNNKLQYVQSLSRFIPYLVISHLSGTCPQLRRHMTVGVGTPRTRQVNVNVAKMLTTTVRGGGCTIVGLLQPNSSV